MKKIAIILMSLILLVGCSNNSTNSNESKGKSTNLFKQEIKDITLAEIKAKNVPDEISEESIEAIINPMIEKSGILVTSKIYSEPSTAMVKNGDEIRGGTKIPLKLFAETVEEEKMKKFLTEVAKIDKKFTIATLDVNKSVDKYNIKLEIVFYSYQSISEVNSNNNFGMVSKLETYKEEDKKVVLRNSDFFGTVRSFNSDISAVRFTKNDGSDTSKVIAKDRNQIENVNLELSKEGKKYYFKYYIDDEVYPRGKDREEFKPKGKEILIDILSSERRKSDDVVGINFIITNTTDKKVDVKVFEDNDKRVNIIYN